MSILLTPHLSLELQQEREPFLGAIPKCRFCHCDDEHACVIAVCEEADGNFRLARTIEETTELVNCTWFLPGICNGPVCMEKLQLELRGQAPVVVFDAYGQRTAS